jgi:hypothetical protein
MNTRSSRTNNRAAVRLHLDVPPRSHITRRHDYSFLSALFTVLAAEGLAETEEEPPGLHK